jgi:hypothetical protein
VLAVIGEALIGAAIVAFEWVADDSSIARTVAVPLHLVNTLLLLAALTVTTSRLVETLVTGARSPCQYGRGGCQGGRFGGGWVW